MADVEVQIDGGIAHITLDRPEKRNALSAAMRRTIQAVFTGCADDDAVVAAVVIGAGSAFCAGGDLEDLGAQAHEATTEEARRLKIIEDAAPIIAVLAFPKPLIAAVNGPAVGAGLSLVLAADVRIASESATFAVPFVKRGLVLDWGLTYLLPRAIGSHNATRLALTGETIGVAEALRIGLVDVVVPDAELRRTAADLATQVAGNAPLAVSATKAIMRREERAMFEDFVAVEAQVLARLRGSADFAEGVAAFVERRAPRWSGR